MKRPAPTPEQAARRQEEAQRRHEQLVADREVAGVLLASPQGEALLRYLEAAWLRTGLGETPERTAYRVAFRDALEQLGDLRDEGLKR